MKLCVLSLKWRVAKKNQVVLFTFNVRHGIKKNRKPVKLFINYILLIVCTVIISCDSSPVEVVPNTDKDYFPLKGGHYRIYDVNEIIYTLGNPDTFIYQLKTVMVDSFLNSESTYTYVIHRSVRDNSSEPWTYKDTWSSRLVNGKAIESEENTDFVKLVFPFQVGAKWNGNAFNTLGDEDYEVENKEEIAWQLNKVNYRDCVKIKQRDNQDFIVYYDRRYETYAKNVGLIYREKTQLTYCTDTDLGCIGEHIVNEGVIYKQSILQYGVE